MNLRSGRTAGLSEAGSDATGQNEEPNEKVGRSTPRSKKAAMRPSSNSKDTTKDNEVEDVEDEPRLTGAGSGAKKGRRAKTAPVDVTPSPLDNASSRSSALAASSKVEPIQNTIEPPPVKRKNRRILESDLRGSHSEVDAGHDASLWKQYWQTAALLITMIFVISCLDVVLHMLFPIASKAKSIELEKAVRELVEVSSGIIGLLTMTTNITKTMNNITAWKWETSATAQNFHVASRDGMLYANELAEGYHMWSEELQDTADTLGWVALKLRSQAEDMDERLKEIILRISEQQNLATPEFIDLYFAYLSSMEKHLDNVERGVNVASSLNSYVGSRSEGMERLLLKSRESVSRTINYVSTRYWSEVDNTSPPWYSFFLPNGSHYGNSVTTRTAKARKAAAESIIKLDSYRQMHDGPRTPSSNAVEVLSDIEERIRDLRNAMPVLANRFGFISDNHTDADGQVVVPPQSRGWVKFEQNRLEKLVAELHAFFESNRNIPAPLSTPTMLLGHDEEVNAQKKKHALELFASVLTGLSPFFVPPLVRRGLMKVGLFGVAAAVGRTEMVIETWNPVTRWVAPALVWLVEGFLNARIPEEGMIL